MLLQRCPTRFGERSSRRFSIIRRTQGRSRRTSTSADLPCRATSVCDAQRRIYHAATEPLAEIDEWLAKYRSFWANKLDALGAYLEQETSP